MSQQPRVFRKSYLDLDFSGVTLSVTDSVATDAGSDFLKFLRNRNNTSGWGTTGSTDAGSTTITVQWSGGVDLDTLILVNHNFKYTIKKWDPDTSAYVDFDTPISASPTAKGTTYHQFDNETIERIQIAISGTITADQDKRMTQLIATSKLSGGGQFNGWPEMAVSEDHNRKVKESISGKSHVSSSIGGKKVRLKFKNWPDEDDIELLDAMHFASQKGFLFWPTGGDEDQFRYPVSGYKNEDIFLAKVSSEWKPSWTRGIYTTGANLTVDLVESI